jgi:hypothetical protein
MQKHWCFCLGMASTLFLLLVTNLEKSLLFCLVLWGPAELF